MKALGDCAGCTLSAKDYSDRRLMGLNPGAAEVNGVAFDRAALAIAIFDGAVLTDVSFTGTDLSGASFVGSRLTNVRFEDLRGAPSRGRSSTGPTFSPDCSATPRCKRRDGQLGLQLTTAGSL